MSKENFLAVLAIFSAVFAGSFFIFPKTVNSYENSKTHPVLTQKTIELYNQIYEPNLTSDEIFQLTAGSKDEDTAPRWINHFYDPTTGDGWLGKRLGNIDEGTVMDIATMVFNREPISAKDWVNNQDLQNDEYPRYKGNKTFDNALLYYLDNDKAQAYYNLGFVLHILQDMSVPAHTRQDSHFDMQVPEEFEEITGVKFDKGEPYENWAKANPAIGDELIKALEKNYTSVCNSLDNCIDYLAGYSNSNFFSEDSILDEDYILPQVDNYKIEKIEGKDSFVIYFSKNNAPLARAKVNNNSGKTTNQSLKYDDITQSYYKTLAPQAVLAGVEVINYFHQQAEKAKNNEIKVEKLDEVSFLDATLDPSPFGEMGLWKEMALDFAARLKTIVTNSPEYTWDIITGMFNRVVDQGFWGAFLSTVPPSSLEDDPNKVVIWDSKNPEQYEDQNDNLLGIGGPIPGVDLMQNFQQSFQDQLDTLAERFDILAELARQFIEQHNPANQIVEENLDEQQGKESQDNNQNQEQNNQNSQNQQNNPPTGGGGAKPVYPKILISEVQIAGLTDAKEEFVELYNPNDTQVDLTDWYIQRKTKTSESYSTFASNNLFSGKKIAAKSYFLIVRQGSSFINKADFAVDVALTEDNSLVLKNPNREISDKLGFGEATDFETAPAESPVAGKTIGRIWEDNQEQDTDNNFVDFELQNPTPKENNIKAINELPLPPNPTDTLSPTVAFDVAAMQDKLDFSVNFTITDVSVEDVTPSGLLAFQLRWKEGDAPPDGGWQQDPIEQIVGERVSHTGIKSVTGKDETTYYFQIKAKDKNNNESDWLPEEPSSTRVSIPKKILINEIQIDSVEGEGGTDDDWVELYNPNDFDVSLSNWSIQKSGKAEECSLETSFYKKNFADDAFIPAHGFYLIADTQANEAIKSMADMLAGWSIADNSAIYLVRKQDKITSATDSDIADKVGFGEACFFEGSPAVAIPEGKTIERKILGRDTDNNAEDFLISLEPTPKDGPLKVFIEDATNYAMCMGGSSPGATIYELKIKWGSKNQSVSYYELQYKLNDGEWQNWFLNTADKEANFQVLYSLLTNHLYKFRVRGYDADGNAGSWIEMTVDLSNPVVINEVAFVGTGEGDLKKDQWIELYNKSDNPVDLTGWKLISGPSNNPTLDLVLEGTIPAKGYFILENIDDDNLPGQKADMIYSGSVSFGQNGGLALRALKNRQEDFAYVPWHGFSEQVFIIDGNYYTAERISPYASGESQKNWKINNRVITNGQNRSGAAIYGTPGQQNSNYQLYTYVYESFIEDTYLPKSLSPYLFDGGIHVFENKTLTIESGSTIKFYNNWGAINVNGTLKANETVFTSFFDDEYGGNSDFDMEQEPNPGNWVGIIFTEKSNNSEIENSIIRYSGAMYGDSSVLSAAVYVNQSLVLIKNSVFEKNKNKGLLLVNSGSVVDNVKFSEHTKIDSYIEGASAVIIAGGNPMISNCQFLDNVEGIKIADWYDINGTKETYGAFPILQNNYFNGNNHAAIWSGDISQPELLSNTAENNQYNGIMLTPGLNRDLTLKPDPGLPYILYGAEFIVPEGKTLTLEPGVVMKFQNNWVGLRVEGTLKAIGRSDLPIIFRQYFDEEWVFPGNWLGLWFTKTSVGSELDNIQIRYGGGFKQQDFGAAIKVEQSAINLTNAVVEKNQNTGVLLVNSASNLDNVQFIENNTEEPYKMEAKGLYIQAGSPTVKNSLFKGNKNGIVLDKWQDPETGEYLMPNATFENITYEFNTGVDYLDLSLIP